MLETCQNCILINAFVSQEGSQVRQNQLLSLKLRMQTILVGSCGLWAVGWEGGGEFLWSLRVDLRVHNVVCQHSPCNISDH
jgi:hypothetical protein